jgi:hypothetical protein
VIAFWLALGALVFWGALGALLDRALGRELAALGPLGWPLCAMLGLVAVLALLLHPVALASLVALALSLARPRECDDRAREPSRDALVVLALLALVLFARPAAPLYWDESIWLAKARLATGDPFVLRAAALDPNADVVPRGYPILAPLATSLLALARGEIEALLAGSSALTWLGAASAIALLPGSRRVPWAVTIACVPFVWPHARSAYLDLPVGLFALALAAACARAIAGEAWAARIAVPMAFLLAGLKDEGLVHTLAIGVTALACAVRRGRFAAGRVVPAIGAALTSALTWHVLLWSNGVENRDHALEGAGLSAVAPLGRALFRAVCDVRSWGLAWPIILGAMVALGMRKSSEYRWLAATWACQLGALFVGVLVSSERVVEFALSGTLFPRMLVQLIPLGAWLVVEAALPPGDARCLADPARPHRSAVLPPIVPRWPTRIGESESRDSS